METIPIVMPRASTDEVRALQRACNHAGAELVVDGALGPRTAAAVLALAVRLARVVGQL